MMKSNHTILFITILFQLLFISGIECLSQDNAPPAIIRQISDQSINEDQHFRLELDLNEVFSDESPLSFSIDKKNADWLANVGDSILVGFPLEEHIGNYEIEVRATDSNGGTKLFLKTILGIPVKYGVIKMATCF